MNDAYDDFMARASQIPLLTQEEELTLGRQVQTMLNTLAELDGSPPSNVAQKRIIKVGQKAKDRMVTANIRLVATIAKNYRTPGIEFIDQVQYGMIGLIRAAEKFDPTRGYKFSTIAYHWIRQAVTRSFSKKNIIYVPEQTQQRTLEVAKMMASEPGLTFTNACKRLRLPKDFAYAAMRANCISLDHILNPSASDSISLGDLVASTDQDAYDRIIEQDEWNQIRLIVSSLPDIDRYIVMSCVQGKTFTEIGEGLGKTREAIADKHRRILSHIKRQYLYRQETFLQEAA